VYWNQHGSWYNHDRKLSQWHGLESFFTQSILTQMAKAML